MARSESLEEVTVESLALILDMNLRPAVQLTQAFLSGMTDTQTSMNQPVNSPDSIVSA
ncbi:MAG: hypothetical protein HC835_12525 [Oscillatoriales cyanobacterium RM2_1_1]|nr:hypothetical protein [Oscillatoriales cyanobacterium SM2_3_0]NJO46378.1 hypothetical protein [Oscillatoriales cyanobacterium RM2_1_1]